MRQRLAFAIFAALAALTFPACSALTPANPAASAAGPGVGCDPCAQAEATPPYSGPVEAAAAAAKGGQEANQAPFTNDTARIHPLTQVSRGSGAASQNTADQETRHTISGGAMNQGLIVPTSAEASTGGGGTSLATQQAALNVAAIRRQFEIALLDPNATPARVESIARALTDATAQLAAASVNDRPTITYNVQGARVSQMGVSSSSSDGRPDPASVKAVAGAASPVGTAALTDVPPPPPPPVSPPEPAAPGMGG